MLLLSLCLFLLKMLTNSLKNFTKLKEDTFIQLQNLSYNLLNSSKVCFNKREITCLKIDKDMKMVLLSWNKLLNKSPSLKKKSKLKVFKLNKRKLKQTNLQQKLKFKKKKYKYKIIKLKLKQTNVVLLKKMFNQRKLLLKKN